MRRCHDCRKSRPDVSLQEIPSTNEPDTQPDWDVPEPELSDGSFTFQHEQTWLCPDCAPERGA